MPKTFDTVPQLLATIKRSVGLANIFLEVKNWGNLDIVLGKYDGIITFASDEIPDIIGFKVVPGGRGIHIRYKMDTIANKLMQKDDTKAFMGDFPADLCAGKYLIFIYANIIEYQYVGDAKAPLLRVMDSKQWLENVSVCELEPTRLFSRDIIGKEVAALELWQVVLEKSL